VADKLRCVVVTPEKTELDVEVESVSLPMYDGQLGVLAGRAPMIGRLGFGRLQWTTGGQTSARFVDGGFVQIANNQVTVLTDALVSLDGLDPNATRQELQAALKRPAVGPQAIEERQLAADRARSKMRLAAPK
jgi:F-type H+-transporting ATPase subunit epsilon